MALPAGDRNLTPFKGTKYIMNLSSATHAANIGLILYLLNNVSCKKEIVIDELNTRVFNPIQQLLKGVIRHGSLTPLIAYQ